MENNIKNKYKDSKNIYVEKVTKLDTLSPLKTLTRGYCLTESDGKIIRKAEELKTGDNINLIFSDGKKSAKVI